MMIMFDFLCLLKLYNYKMTLQHIGKKYDCTRQGKTKTMENHISEMFNHFERTSFLRNRQFAYETCVSSERTTEFSQAY